jgi:hypothetical protein
VAFSVGIAGDASAMHDVKYGLDAPPSTGLSGRAAHVGAAFSVGIASDALVLA